MSFELRVDEVAENISSIVKKKNKDYGNSYEKMINRYGEVALLIRFQDKLGRLDSLVLKGQDQKVADESIEDTLMDIAGYAILELVRRKQSDDIDEMVKKEVEQLESVKSAK